eukprot:m.31131 g.31131  ORF g.31131 m.31131 type:complete len:323 (-) comp12037_c0_seq1:266-1234(-)
MQGNDDGAPFFFSDASVFRAPLAERGFEPSMSQPTDLPSMSSLSELAFDDVNAATHELLSISNDGFFRMLQTANPEMNLPHQSEIEGLNIEMSSLMASDSNMMFGSCSQSLLQAINLASSVQPQDKRTEDYLQSVVATQVALDKNQFPAVTHSFKNFSTERESDDAASATRSASAVSDEYRSSEDCFREPKRAPKRDKMRRRGVVASINKRKPTREEFDSDVAFSQAWSEWRSVRQRNNAAVQRSREKAKAKKAIHRQFQRDKERKVAQLAMEAEMLRKNVDVLLKAVNDPSALTAIEQAWVQTLSHSNTGTVLASQCALYS